MNWQNWHTVEDVELTVFHASKLELVPFLKSNEDKIVGEELRRRARELNANLGVNDMWYLLDNTYLLPREFNEHCLVFPGCVRKDFDGNLMMLILVRAGRGVFEKEWYVSFRRLDFACGGSDRLVRPTAYYSS